MKEQIIITISLILFIAGAWLECASADPAAVDMRFSWDAVTTNADDTPCTDLHGYAIYRSRVNTPEALDNLLVLGDAFILVPPDQTTVAIHCPEDGIWYWIIRAYDHAGNIGGYGGSDNVITTDVDVVFPGQTFHFSIIGASLL